MKDSIKIKDAFRFYFKCILYGVFMGIVMILSKIYLNSYENINVPITSFKGGIISICYIIYHWFAIGIVLLIGIVIIYTLVVLLIKFINKILYKNKKHI